MFDTLLETAELASLGPGPRSGRKSISEVDQLLASNPEFGKISTAQKSLVRALILLWHDHLDEAHTISQDVSTPDGSFIHGIVHRREPDYGNAKYWFHRVGQHAAFPEMARRASALPAAKSESALLERFCRGQEWDPFALIDCCQKEFQSGSAGESFLRSVQKAETDVLLEHLAGEFDRRG